MAVTGNLIAGSLSVLNTNAFITGGPAGNDYLQIATPSSGLSGIVCKNLTGLIGVNQLNPAYNLDVTGTGRFTSSLRLTGASPDVPAINPDAYNSLMIYEDCIATVLNSGTLTGNAIAPTSSNNYIQLTSNASTVIGQAYWILNPGNAFIWTAETFFGGGSTSGNPQGGNGFAFYAYSSATPPTVAIGAADPLYSGVPNGYCLGLTEFIGGSGIVPANKTLVLSYNGTLLTSANPSLNYNVWSTLKIILIRNLWKIYYNSTLILQFQDSNRNTAGNNCMGVTASTGAAINAHYVRNVRVSKYATDELWSQGTLTSSNISYSAGNVGIGTATPQYTLDVNGAIQYGNSDNASMGHSQLAFFKKSGFPAAIACASDSWIPFGKTSIAAASGGPMSAPATASWTEYMRLTSTGSLGIGVTSPQFLLDVNGTGRFSGTLAANAGVVATGNSGFGVNAPSARVHAVSSGVTGGTGDQTNVTGAALLLNDSTNYPRMVHLSTDSAVSAVYNFQTGKAVYWGESGDTGGYHFRGRAVNVWTSLGVGSSSLTPTYTLDVFGTSRMRQAVIGTGSLTSLINNPPNGLTLASSVSATVTSPHITVYPNTVYPTYQQLNYSADNTANTWDSYYDYGVGFWRRSSTAVPYMMLKNNGNLAFQVAPAGTATATISSWGTALSINSSGQVGINTGAPAFTLDVSGAQRVTGGIRTTSVNNNDFLLGSYILNERFYATLTALGSGTVSSPPPTFTYTFGPYDYSTQNLTLMNGSISINEWFHGYNNIYSSVGANNGSLYVNGYLEIYLYLKSYGISTQMLKSIVANGSTIKLTVALSQAGAPANFSDGSPMSTIYFCTTSFYASSANGYQTPFIDITDIIRNNTDDNLYIRIHTNSYNVGNSQYDYSIFNYFTITINDQLLNIGNQIVLDTAKNFSIYNAASTTSSMRVTAGGNIGLGTNNPQYLLDVNGVARITSTCWFNNQIQNQVLCLYTNDGVPSSISTNYFGLGINNGTLRYQAANITDRHAWYASTTQLMTLSPSGMAVTAGSLSIVGTGSFPLVNIYNPGAPTRLKIDGDYAQQSGVSLSSAGVETGILYRPVSSSDTRMYTPASGDIMTWTATGRVGIGNTSPQYILDVAGNARIGAAYMSGLAFSSNMYVANQSLVGNLAMSFALSQGSGGDTVVNSASGNSLQFKIGNTEYMRIASSGALGIGYTNPQYVLDVNGTGHFASSLTLDQGVVSTAFNSALSRPSGGLYILGDRSYGMELQSNPANSLPSGNATTFLTRASDGWFVFKKVTAGFSNTDAGTNLMVINNVGSVGIGTGSPQYQLDVNGAVRLGSPTLGQRIFTAGGATGAGTLYTTPTYLQVGVLDNITAGGNGALLHIRGALGPWLGLGYVDISFISRSGFTVIPKLDGVLSNTAGNNNVVNVLAYQTSANQYAIYLYLSMYVYYDLEISYSGAGVVSGLSSTTTSTVPSGTQVFSLATTQSINVSPTGVAIGTNMAAYQLDVAGTSRSQQVIAGTGSISSLVNAAQNGLNLVSTISSSFSGPHISVFPGTQYPTYFQLNYASDNTSKMFDSYNDTVNFRRSNTSTPFMMIKSNSQLSFNWATAGTASQSISSWGTALSINSAGLVGIGTTASFPLDVVGNTRIINTGAALRCAFQTLLGVASPIFLDFTTYLGQGPAGVSLACLDDSNYSGHLLFYIKTPGASTNAQSEKMRLTSAGNLGIGTSTPTFTLDVNGTGRFSGPLKLSGGSPDIPGLNPDAYNSLLVYEDCIATLLNSGTLTGSAIPPTASNSYIQLTSNTTSIYGQVYWNLNPGNAFVWTAETFFGGGSVSGNPQGGNGIAFYAFTSSVPPNIATGTGDPLYYGVSGGYALSFTEFVGGSGYVPANKTIALSYNGTLLTTATPSLIYNAWSTVKIIFVRNQWKVYLNSALVLQYQDANRAVSGSSLIGISSTTGAATNAHYVRNVRVSKYAADEFWASGTLSSTNISYTAGNVGIGTSSATYALDVIGLGTTSYVGARFTYAPQSTAVVIEDYYPGVHFNSAFNQNTPINRYFTGNGLYAGGLFQNPSTGLLTLAVSSITGTATSSPVGFVTGLNMLPNGQVGINTNSPAYTLDVNGSIQYGTSDNAAMGHAHMAFFKKSGNQAALACASDTHLVFGKSSVTNTSGGALSNPGSANFTEYMRLTNTGSLGIGTTNPQATLDVGGAARFAGSVSVITTNDPVMSLYNSSVKSRLNIDGLAANDCGISFRAAGVETGVLYRPPGSNDTRMYTNGGGDVMSWTTAGRVGIGTTIPTARVHIVGAGMTGGSGDFTNVSNPTLILNDPVSYNRIAHTSADVGINTVFNFQTGKNVYWGEINDTGGFYFRGRTFTSYGNMGVGSPTLLPSYTLDIFGTSRAQQAIIGTGSLTSNNASTIASNGIAMISTVSNTLSGGPHIAVYPNTAYPSFHQLNFAPDNTSLNFDSYYDNAFRRSSNVVPFQIYKNTSILSINYAAAGTVTQAITWGTALLINASGQVGINNSSPSFNLDVIGSARITSALTVASQGYWKYNLTTAFSYSTPAYTPPSSYWTLSSPTGSGTIMNSSGVITILQTGIYTITLSVNTSSTANNQQSIVCSGDAAIGHICFFYSPTASQGVTCQSWTGRLSANATLTPQYVSGSGTNAPANDGRQLNSITISQIVLCS